MADQIQVNYETLADIQKKFAQITGDVSEMGKQLGSQILDLREKGWKGEASDAFYQEMNEVVAPAIRKLGEALDRAAETTGVVIKTFNNAEDEVKGMFGSGAQ